jgi:hypothetical protein
MEKLTFSVPKGVANRLSKTRKNFCAPSLAKRGGYGAGIWQDWKRLPAEKR